MPGKLRGCGRGVFGLKSWDPLPRPGPTSAEGAVNDTHPNNREPNFRERTTTQRELRSEDRSSSNSREAPKSDLNPLSKEFRPTQQNVQLNSSGDTPQHTVPRPGKLLIAKYSYKANPDSPIGAELSFQRGDKIRFKSVSGANEHWWLAEDERGGAGHVPASYMYVTEEVKGLPWLEHRAPESSSEEEPEDTQPKIICKFGAPAQDPNQPRAHKPYIPTYDLKGEKQGSSKLHCEVCNRYFNGEIPYRSHLASKAHKEEVAVAEEYARGK